MNIAEVIARHSPPGTQHATHWQGNHLSEIDSGILFVLAIWSGQSLAALKMLTTHLGQLEAPPKLLVTDIDSMPEAVAKLLGPLRGLGETYWIRRGAVVGKVLDFRAVQWQPIVTEFNRLII